MKHKRLCGGRRKGVAEDASPFRVGSLGKQNWVREERNPDLQSLDEGDSWIS